MARLIGLKEHETRLPYDPFDLENEISFSDAREIPYKDKVVVCFQARAESNSPFHCGSYVLVPGFKASEPFPYQNDLEQMEVEQIPESEHEEIIKMLQEMGYKGPINFWSKEDFAASAS
jgi:hypothetical protein